MARKRSGRHGGGGRRSKAYRASNFRATCSSCGIVMQVPVRPPAGIELKCVNCLAKESAEKAKQPASVG